MRDKKRLFLTAILGIGVFASSCGIAGKDAGLSQSKMLEKKVEPFKKKSKISEMQAKSNYNRIVEISVEETPVYNVIEGVCNSYNIPCNLTHKPSDKLKLTLKNYKGTLGGLLSIIKRETGLDYKFNGNVLGLANYSAVRVSDENTPEFNHICEKEITISFNRVPLIDVLNYFSKEYGYTFKFAFLKNGQVNPLFYPESLITGRDEEKKQEETQTDDLLSMTQKSQSSGKNETSSSTDGQSVVEQVITSYYHGCDPREALYNILNSIDYVVAQKGATKFEIRNYEQLIVDKSIFFDYNVSANTLSSVSAASSGGKSSSTSTSTSTSSSSSGDAFTLSENYRQSVESYISKFLSPDGRVVFSPRGYIVVEDSPSRISVIKDIIEKEIQKEEAIKLKVQIVRVDLNDDYKAGVDWNLLLKKSLGSVKNIAINTAFGQGVNGVTIKGDYRGLTSAISLLSEYGDVKIVKEFESTARSGLPVSFKAVDKIPYATVNVQTGTQGNSSAFPEVKEIEAGLKILLMPNLSNDPDKVDLSTSIEVSEYRGDKTFNLGQAVGTVVVPLISINRIVTPSKIKFGESMIVTGFHIDKKAVLDKGLPFIAKLPVVGELFGYKNHSKQDSELIFIITPERVEN